MSNVIILVNDTFRQDHIGGYGRPAPWTRLGREGEPFIRTPNLDRLAAESAVFDRFYCASYPTVPCRYDCFTGRYGFPTRGWQPLEPDDVILSEIVQSAGCIPMLIYDTPMLGNDSYNFTRGFAGYDFIRGQHADRFNVDPIDPRLPAAPHKLKNLDAIKLYLRNIVDRRGEADWMCSRTIARVLDWLERNRNRDNFVLWVDMWDPHEPFDPPEYDLARYAQSSFAGDRIIYPVYGRCSYMDDAELNHVRAMYAGLATLVDRGVGRVLEKLETLGLDKNTLLVYLSDHGHLFGEHGLQGKPSGIYGQLYEVTARVPMMIRHPKGVGAGRRIEALGQHPDLLPTVLEFLGIRPPEGIHGKSLWPIIEGRADSIREYAFSGRYSREEALGGGFPSYGRPIPRRQARGDAAAFDGQGGGGASGEPITVTSLEWTYIYSPANGRRELYDLRRDPGQTSNLAEAHFEIVDSMHRALLDFLAEAGASPGLIQLYRAPLPKLRLDPDTQLHVVRDRSGRAFAFTNAMGASAVISQALSLRSPELASFGTLADREPRALIYICEEEENQYYWAEDLR